MRLSQKILAQGVTFVQEGGTGVTFTQEVLVELAKSGHTQDAQY